MTVKRIDIVIPIHNEKMNLIILIPKLLKIINKIIKQYKCFFIRLIFIDDGSNDKGCEIIRKYLKKNGLIKLLVNKNKKGQTYCYKKYFLKFDSDYFIRIDGDNQDNPEHLIKIFSLIKKDYDIIMTRRKFRKHSFLMVFLTFLYDYLIFFLIRKKLKTYSSSLICFKRIYIKFKNLRFNDHRYLPLIAINNGANKIKIFDTIHQKRKFGISKYKISNKILTALPEFIFFYIRLKIGKFN